MYWAVAARGLGTLGTEPGPTYPHRLPEDKLSVSEAIFPVPHVGLFPVNPGVGGTAQPKHGDFPENHDGRSGESDGGLVAKDRLAGSLGEVEIIGHVAELFDVPHARPDVDRAGRLSSD